MTFISDQLRVLAQQLDNDSEHAVPIPRNADQAVLMITLGVHFLETNAPGRLRPEMRPLANDLAAAFK